MLSAFEKLKIQGSLSENASKSRREVVKKLRRNALFYL
jgi:hypothetical protein